MSSAVARSAAISQAPPGDGDHAQPASPQHARPGDDFGGKQKVLDRVDPHDAELPAHAVEHPVIADQRAGVRLRRARGHVGKADLEDDQRLGSRQRPLRRRREPIGVADRLDEHRDRADPIVIEQMIDESRTVEVGLVAGGDHVADADLLLRGETGDERRRGAALGDDRDRTRPGGTTEGAGPQRHIIEEVDEPQAVRTEHVDAVPPCRLGERALLRCPVAAGLGEARREDHRIARARRAEIGHRVLDAGDRHHDQAEIDGLADRRARRRGGTAVHDAAAPRDEMHLTLIGALGEVVERVQRPAGPVGGADQRDRARPQHGRQIAPVHHVGGLPVRHQAEKSSFSAIP